MDPKIKKIIDILKQARMTDDERSLMRQNLLSVMQKETKKFQPSPYVGTNIWAWFVGVRGTYVAMACLMVIVFSGSIALVAGKALPGDLLYPIKIAVNENVLRTFSKTSPSAEVNFETAILKDRLVEAEQLDKNNKLNFANETELQNNIVNQRGRVDKAIAKLENTASSTPDAISTDKNFTDKREDKSPKISVSINTQTLITASTTNNISSKDNRDNKENNTQEAEKAVLKVNNLFKDHSEIIDKIGLRGLNSENEGRSGSDNTQRNRGD